MRFVLVSLLFFFAPVIALFALRYLLLMLRIRSAWQHARDAEGKIIDITPRQPQPASRVFIVLAVLVGIACAALVWSRMHENSAPEGTYVPAHVDTQGHLVPGHFKKP